MGWTHAKEERRWMMAGGVVRSGAMHGGICDRAELLLTYRGETTTGALPTSTRSGPHICISSDKGPLLCVVGGGNNGDSSV